MATVQRTIGGIVQAVGSDSRQKTVNFDKLSQRENLQVGAGSVYASGSGK